MTLGELRSLVADSRFVNNQPVFIRIVDRSKINDDGSYQAVEIPLVGGMTGWMDNHVSILAYGSLDQISANK